MNCDSCDDPKNAWMTALTVRAFTRSSSEIFSGSVLIDMRSLTRRAMRDRPTENWLAISSPTERIRRLARGAMSSLYPPPPRSSEGERVVGSEAPRVRTGLFARRVGAGRRVVLLWGGGE